MGVAGAASAVNASTASQARLEATRSESQAGARRPRTRACRACPTAWGTPARSEPCSHAGNARAP
eukprot:11574059-Alexandrium_andersonii.AAC.1